MPLAEDSPRAGAAAVGPWRWRSQISGSCDAAADPEREERRQDADEEHRAPAVARLDDQVDERPRSA